jgi:hypothetical protein
MRRDNDKEDVSSYWMALRARGDTGNCKRKLQNVLSGEIALEETVDLS